MAKLYNLARMTTATAGTGTITLGAAVSGYLTFALAGVANGDVVDYAIKDGANSEHGTGTYTTAGLTLTRTVTKSTNGNAAINLSGTAEVFISPRAETLNDASVIVSGTVATARLGTGTANNLSYLRGDQTWANLSKAIQVGSTDLNNLKTPGFYDGSSFANSPDGTTNWFYVQVSQHSGFVASTNEYLVQTAWDLFTGVIYTRTETGGTWNAWKKMLVAADIGTSVQAYLGYTPLNVGGNQTIFNGFNVTPNNLGNITSFTINPLVGNYQYGTNNGAATWTVPSSDCAVDILITNNGSAGAITFSGFSNSANTGDPLTTTNGHKFLISICKVGGTGIYLIKALQ